MLLVVPRILNPAELQEARTQLGAARWAEGSSSAGTQAAQVKNNQQLPQDDATARHLRRVVLQALDRQPQFFSAALPRKVYPPTFNRYHGHSNAYGRHVDNAIRYAPDSGQKIRTDLSCTLFLSDPDSYDGGALVLHEPGGPRAIKLAAGDLVLYPGTTVHEVEPVTRGERLACFFWIESMVRNGEQRQLLYGLDETITQLRASLGETPQTLALTGTYHNLLRQWAEA